MEITLRTWRETDAESLLIAVRESPDLVTQLPVAELSTAEACREFILANLAPGATAAHNFAISLDGAAVGNIGVSSIDRAHDTAWTYYWLTASSRGRGLTTRALATAAAWAFDDLGLFRLELGHRVNNPASCRVATAAGFVPEGIERAKLRYGEERFDVETHARLRTDLAPTLVPVELCR